MDPNTLVTATLRGYQTNFSKAKKAPILSKVAWYALEKLRLRSKYPVDHVAVSFNNEYVFHRWDGKKEPRVYMLDKEQRWMPSIGLSLVKEVNLGSFSFTWSEILNFLGKEFPHTSPPAMLDIKRIINVSLIPILGSHVALSVCAIKHDCVNTSDRIINYLEPKFAMSRSTSPSALIERAEAFFGKAPNSQPPT